MARPLRPRGDLCAEGRSTAPSRPGIASERGAAPVSAQIRPPTVPVDQSQVDEQYRCRGRRHPGNLGGTTMDKHSISRQERLAQDCLSRRTPWHRQVVAGMRWVPMLVLFSASAAMAAPTVLDFEDIAAGTRITTQYSPRGVLFRNHFLGTDPAAPSGTRVLRTANPADEIFTPIPLVMTFTSAAQSRVQLLATSGILLSLGRSSPLMPPATWWRRTVPSPSRPTCSPPRLRSRTRTPRRASRGRSCGSRTAYTSPLTTSIRGRAGPLGAARWSRPDIVEIREADPKVDKAQHDFMRSCLIEAVGDPQHDYSARAERGLGLHRRVRRGDTAEFRVRA